ncbi:Ldh family oxidoreductase [Bradyrhizobium sp.]|uniref:Ldh family oxidoreductase n=1 Tax=Bradyrhizobium sp. TaxID=376 RepID=UPI002C403F34|nr:Ldh family oxidoreductase [Bradyrhizobium sp.]HMM90543.1 Ldh family oxidoreductase [Bradyrhizobium sp.]
MTTSSSERRVKRESLLQVAKDLLRGGGFSAEQASQTADLLIWANLRGIDSHGVLRIPRYVEMCALGLINVAAVPREVAGRGAIRVIDAGRAPGAQGMNLAAATAVGLAETHGIGWCAVRAISHAGAIGYYAEHVARRGFVGIVMTASKPLMVYYGAKGEAVSTNPLAISAPTADAEHPLILDMSTAAVALGKIMAAKDSGLPIPLGWAVDKNGFETTSPAAAKAVLPMAGPKGSGLSLMIEVLASVMSGNPLISMALKTGNDPGVNGLVAALDPAAFGTSLPLGAAVQELCDAIKALPPVNETEPVLLPGERSLETMRTRLQEGIPVATGTLKRLAELGGKLGVNTSVIAP